MKRDGSFDELLRLGLLAAAGEDEGQGREALKLSPNYCAWRRAFLQSPFRAARRRPKQGMRAAACLCIFLAGALTAASVTLSWPALRRWVTGQEQAAPSNAETFEPPPHEEHTPPREDHAPPQETEPVRYSLKLYYTIETDGAGADFETKRELARQLEALTDTRVFGVHDIEGPPGVFGLHAVQLDGQMLEALSPAVMEGSELQETGPGVLSCWVGSGYGELYGSGDSFEAYLLGEYYRFEVAGVLASGAGLELAGGEDISFDEAVVLPYPADTEAQCDQRLLDTYVSRTQLEEAKAILAASGLEAGLSSTLFTGVRVCLGEAEGLFVPLYSATDGRIVDYSYDELQDEDLYRPLVQLDEKLRAMGSREVVQMPVTVWGYYEGDARFAAYQPNSVAWTDEDGNDVYTTELKTVRLDESTVWELAGDDAFPAGAYAISRDAAALPCLLGSGYEGVYAVGDSFQVDLSGVRTYDLQVTGFLSPGASVTAGGEETVLDDYIILPSFRYTDVPEPPFDNYRDHEDCYVMNWFYAHKLAYFHVPAACVREVEALLESSGLRFRLESERCPVEGLAK